MTAELDKLEQQAINADQAAGLAVNGEGQTVEAAEMPEPVDYSREAAATVDTFAALACGFAPDVAHLWGDDTKKSIAGALAPVLEKYGMTLGNIPPEVTLLIVAGPTLWQTARIMALKFKKPAPAAEGEGEAQQMARTVEAAP